MVRNKKCHDQSLESTKLSSRNASSWLLVCLLHWSQFGENDGTNIRFTRLFYVVNKHQGQLLAVIVHPDSIRW